MANSKYEMGEARKNFANNWSTDLLNAPLRDCPTCCLSALCPMCMSFWLRKKALGGDLSRYECCAGSMPCSGKCGERKCPCFCLGMEVFCCFPTSVASTRFLIQDEYNIKNTKCDNCLIGFMFCLSQLACIFRLVAIFTDIDMIDEAANVLTMASDIVYCTVCACLQTQHKVELEERAGTSRGTMTQPPPQQLMSRTQEPGYPANVGAVVQSYPMQAPVVAQPYSAYTAPGAPQGYPGAPQGYPGAPQPYPGAPQPYAGPVMGMPQGYPPPQQQQLFRQN